MELGVKEGQRKSREGRAIIYTTSKTQNNNSDFTLQTTALILLYNRRVPQENVRIQTGCISVKKGEGGLKC